MEETIKTVSTNGDNEKTVSIWVARGPHMTRVPGKIDHVILVTHEQGTDTNNWQISVPTGAAVDVLVPVLIESLKKFCEERNIGLATRPPAAAPVLRQGPRTRTETLPLPKGMTKEQIEELAQGLNGLKSRTLSAGEPPK